MSGQHNFDLAQQHHWVHRVANLVLLTRRKNSQAGNFDFDKKKKQYFMSAGGTSPFALTTQVLMSSTWTEEVLVRRQNRSCPLSPNSGDWAMNSSPRRPRTTRRR